MKLVRLHPMTPEWDALASAGGGEFLGEKAGMELWAICSPSPIGVLGFEKLRDDCAECQLWVREDRRGRWWTRAFYPMLLAVGFSRAKTLIAAVVEGSASHRIVAGLGWKKYCQQDGLSYYQITMKDCMGEPAQA